MFLVHANRNPSAADWSTWTEAYAEGAALHSVRALLVVSGGGGPNGRQRSQVIARVIGRVGAAAEGMRTAVCGDSAMVRAITTAIGWLTAAPHLKSFRHAEREEALEFLRVPARDRTEILSSVQRLEDELSARF
jgi:hypothetical protein